MHFVHLKKHAVWILYYYAMSYECSLVPDDVKNCICVIMYQLHKGHYYHLPLLLHTQTFLNFNLIATARIV